MRRDGDLLVTHLASAKKNVLLCAPFIKLGVAKRLLAAIDENVAVEIVTRWHADEVAAGVSDLAVFDLVAGRPNTQLRLLDNLHAKLYVADKHVFAGSANLTATALGWCNKPNLELLLPVPADAEAVVQCMAALSSARLATADERNVIEAAAEKLDRSPLPESHEIEEALSGVWLPKLAAPEKLYSAYLPSARSRLTSSAIEAADHDLQALTIEPGLAEPAFRKLVGDRLSTMPAVRAIMSAAQSDLTDAAAVALVETLIETLDMSAAARWQIVREWLTYFLHDRYEIAPESYVTRLRPGAGRE